MMTSRLLVVSVLVLGMYGCGDNGSDTHLNIPTDFGPPSNGKFTYEEGKGGTTPGLWARTTVEGAEIVSNEVEVVLRPKGGVVQQEMNVSDNDSASQQLLPAVEYTLGDQTRRVMPLRTLIEQDPEAFGRRVAERFKSSQDKIDKLFGPERQDNIVEPDIMDDAVDPLDPANKTVRQALKDPCPGQYPKSRGGNKMMGTFDGWTAILDWTGSSTHVDYIWAKHYAPEGNYFTLQKGFSASVPADPISAGWMVNYTMIKAPKRGPITVDFLNDTTSIGFSADGGYGGLSMSFSYNIVVHPVHGTVGVGIGFGMGLSAGFFGLIKLPIAFNLSSAGIVSGGDPGYFIYTGSNKACSVEPKKSRDTNLTVRQGLNPNPMAQINAATAQQASSTPDSRRNALSNSASGMMNPLFSALSDTTGHGPAKHVTAATNADLYADYLERGDDCTDGCPDTSFSYINARGVSLARNAQSNADKLQVGYSGIMKVMESVPQINMQWALQKPTTAAISLIEEGVLGGSEEDAHRYVSDELKYTTVEPGVSVDFDITAEEIAALVSAQPSDIEGAKICLELLMDLDGSPVCTTLSNGVVTGSFVLREVEQKAFLVTVDLASAAGYVGQDVSDWIVKPAIRIFVPKASPRGASSILLTGPKSIVSGGPMSLSAMLVDENGVPIDTDAKFEFLNYKGEVIGSASPKHGVATFQYVPAPVDPDITSFESKVIKSTDGKKTYNGYGMRGTALSRYSKVLIDNKPVSDNDGKAVPNGHLNWAIRPIDHKSAAFVPYDDASRLTAGTHTLKLVDTEGKSTSFTFEITD